MNTPSQRRDLKRMYEREYIRRWRAVNPQSTREDRWRRRNIKSAIDQSQFLKWPEYEAKFQAQDGRCGNPFCDIPLDIGSKKTQADHDHVTGIFRMVLCQRCNLDEGVIRRLGSAQIDWLAQLSGDFQ